MLILGKEYGSSVVRVLLVVIIYEEMVLSDVVDDVACWVNHYIIKRNASGTYNTQNKIRKQK